MDPKDLAVNYEEFLSKFEVDRTNLERANLGRYQGTYDMISALLRQLIGDLQSFDNG